MSIHNLNQVAEEFVKDLTQDRSTCARAFCPRTAPATSAPADASSSSSTPILAIIVISGCSLPFGEQLGEFGEP
jgi:hypothetical protein